MLILGDKEVEDGSIVAVRSRNGDQCTMSTEEFINKVYLEDKEKIVK